MLLQILSDCLITNDPLIEQIDVVSVERNEKLEILGGDRINFPFSDCCDHLRRNRSGDAAKSNGDVRR